MYCVGESSHDTATYANKSHQSKHDVKCLEPTEHAATLNNEEQDSWDGEAQAEDTDRRIDIHDVCEKGNKNRKSECDEENSRTQNPPPQPLFLLLSRCSEQARPKGVAEVTHNDR